MPSLPPFPSWHRLAPFDWRNFAFENARMFQYRFDGKFIEIANSKTIAWTDWTTSIHILLDDFTDIADQLAIDARILCVASIVNIRPVQSFEKHIHAMSSHERADPLIALYRIHQHLHGLDQEAFKATIFVGWWNGLARLIHDSYGGEPVPSSTLTPTEPQTPYSRGSSGRIPKVDAPIVTRDDKK